MCEKITIRNDVNEIINYLNDETLNDEIDKFNVKLPKHSKSLKSITISAKKGKHLDVSLGWGDIQCKTICVDYLTDKVSITCFAGKPYNSARIGFGYLPNDLYSLDIWQFGKGDY